MPIIHIQYCDIAPTPRPNKTPPPNQQNNENEWMNAFSNEHAMQTALPQHSNIQTTAKSLTTRSTPYAATLSTPSTTFSATEGVLVAPSTMTVFTLATASLTTSFAPSLISPVIESRAAAGAAVSTI